MIIFPAPVLVKHLRYYAGALQHRISREYPAVMGQQVDPVELYLFTWLRRKLLHLDHVPGRDAILFAPVWMTA